MSESAKNVHRMGQQRSSIRRRFCDLLAAFALVLSSLYTSGLVSRAHALVRRSALHVIHATLWVIQRTAGCPPSWLYRGSLVGLPSLPARPMEHSACRHSYVYARNCCLLPGHLPSNFSPNFSLFNLALAVNSIYLTLSSVSAAINLEFPTQPDLATIQHAGQTKLAVNGIGDATRHKPTSRFLRTRKINSTQYPPGAHNREPGRPGL